MKYYGIKTPKRYDGTHLIWWITQSKHDSWMAFFQYPNNVGERNAHNLPLADAVRAYEGIGYSCVELEVLEVSKPNESSGDSWNAGDAS